GGIVFETERRGCCSFWRTQVFHTALFCILQRGWRWNCHHEECPRCPRDMPMMLGRNFTHWRLRMYRFLQFCRFSAENGAIIRKIRSHAITFWAIHDVLTLCLVIACSYLRCLGS